MSWTEEKISKLKELWGKGKTASQIAEIIGGITRNAVIGKVHRLGLSNRETKSIKQVSEPTEVKSVSKRGRPRKNQTTADEQKSSKESKRGKLNLSIGLSNKKTGKNMERVI